MSFTSRLGIGLTFGLLLSLSTPFIIPAISHNSRLATAQAQTQPTAFSDVPANYWARDYIAGLTKLNIISGFGDGTFRPNDPVTRAQFAAILRQAFLKSQPTTAQSFKDVPAGYWATDAIAASRSAGFLSGYPGNTFKPNDRILRVQALVSLANGLKYPTGNPQSLSNYKDAGTVPDYARPSTAAAAQANLVVSYPTPDQILPNRAASRAEVAAFVYQALVKAGRVDPIAMKPERRWQTTPITTIAAQASAVSLSRDGQRIAAIAGDNLFELKTQVWNTQTGALLKTFMAQEDYRIPFAVDISQDGTKVAFITSTLYTSDLQLTVQDVENGSLLLTKSLNPSENQFPKPNPNASTGRGVSGLAISPDGKQVITQVNLQVYGADTLYSRLDFRDIATGKVTQSINLLGVDDNNSVGFVVSPDGNLIASLSTDYRNNNIWNLGIVTRVTIWQRNKDNRFDYLTTLPISNDEQAVFNVAFTNSNLLNLTATSSLTELIAERPSETRLETWNPRTAERVSSTVLPMETCIKPSRVALSPDGTSYYSSSPIMQSPYDTYLSIGTEPNTETCSGDIKTGAFQKLPAQPFAYQAFEFSSDENYSAIATVSKFGSSDIQIFSKSQN
ncbi:MAG: hypothetical protein DCF25_18780 [Leptolyngbya foveolarum]|uniref:SLH domain-containing protein n=1 Tax=Leptolyngbya foveolarum TaxID=47253 RepID=A0A2W4U3A5_9CYAN|nr:S-layer homology domain-containing protein [Leptolyngbya sp. BC1307]PZO11769.1 MAG: hypothetical protein DCF25_18780 [Leptolyngbya foveolarum]